MDQRNLIIAIAISIAILIAFQFLFEQPRLTSGAGNQATQTQPSQPQPGSPAPATPTPTAPGAAPPAGGGTVAAAATRESALAGAPRVKIDTPKLHGSIDLAGGRLDDLTLAQFHETVDPKSPEIVLLSPAGAPEPYFVDFGWVPADSSVKVPDAETRWTASTDTLTTKTPVTLTWDNGAGLRFTRTISVDDNYMFTVKQRVENTGGQPVKLLSYASAARVGTPQTQNYWVLFEGMLGDFNGVLKTVKYANLKSGEPESVSANGAWLGFTDKYWLTSLVPPQDETIQGRFTHTLVEQRDRYQADYLGAEQSLAPR
jgi:YidC/Oxa1 family membrane protein insertase